MDVRTVLGKFSFKRFAGILLGNVLITGAYAFITVPHEIINGGVTSFSMVLERLTGLVISIFVNVITIALLIACLLFLGTSFFMGSIVSCVCYLGLFTAFHSLDWEIEIPLIACVALAGVLVGAGYHLCIRSKSTTVGFDAIALMLNKRNPRVNVAGVMFVINILVLLSGLAAYGARSILYGAVFTALQAGTLNALTKLTESREVAS